MQILKSAQDVWKMFTVWEIRMFERAFAEKSSKHIYEHNFEFHVTKLEKMYDVVVYEWKTEIMRFQIEIE